jgi:hypothetical protein
MVIEETKICLLPLSSTATTIPTKEKKKRVITQTKKWKIKDEDLNPHQQIQLLQRLHLSWITTNSTISGEDKQTLVLQNIRQKISGYKFQDMKKGIYNENEIIELGEVIQLLFESNIECYYCRNTINLLYENVRDPRQWTLERLDNTFGHIRGNLVIACLSCNIKRRTMYPERFIFTKQCVITKII